MARLGFVYIVQISPTSQHDAVLNGPRPHSSDIHKTVIHSYFYPILSQLG